MPTSIDRPSTSTMHLALAHDGLLVLGDLVALRQVGIEVVLPVEDRAPVDLRLEAQTGADRLLDAEFVDDRAACRAWRHRRGRHGHSGSPPNSAEAPENSLDLARHLGMDLQADDDFPIAGRALDPVLLFGHALCGFHHLSPVDWRLGTGLGRRVQDPGFASSRAIDRARRRKPAINRASTTMKPVSGGRALTE